MGNGVQLTEDQFERWMETQERSQGSTDRSLSNLGRDSPSAGDSFGSSAARNAFNQQFANISQALQATNIQSLVNQVQSFVDPKGPVPEFIRLQEEMGGLAGEMGKQLEGGGAITNTYAATLDDLNKKLLGARGTKTAFSEMGVSLSNMLGDMPEAMEGFDRLATGADSSANSFRLMKDRTKDELSEIALGIATFGDRMGLSTSESAALVEREMSKTGKAGTDILREAAVASSRIAAQIGDSSKEIMNITANLIADTQRYGNVSVQEAARIGASLRQLGLDYGELNSMVDKFFSFDGAVQSVSALTSVFGVQLDAMEMMMMANQNQGAMLEYVREQFLATGKSVDDMTLAEKRLVQQQLGLSDIQAVERLFDPSADIMAMEDLGTDAELKAGDVQQSMEELSTEIRRFGGNTQKALDRMAEQAYRAALANQQMTLGRSTALIQEFYSDVEKVAQEAGNDIAELAGVDSLFGSMNQAADKFSKEFSQGIVKGLELIIPEIGRIFQEALEKAGLKEQSPSIFGMEIYKGIEKAFELIPDSFHSVMKDAGEQGQEAFNNMLSDEDGALVKWGKKLGEAGFTIRDFTEGQIEELKEKFSISQENLQTVLSKFADKDAIKARRFENQLAIAAQQLGGMETDAFKAERERIAQAMNLTIEGKAIEDSSAQESANQAKDAVAASDANTEEVSKLTEEVKLLRDALAETRENQSIAVKIIADPIVLNLMEDGTAKQIAVAAIKGTQLDARGGTNDARIQLTTVETV